MLAREEYVEQSYLFRMLCERMGNNIAVQELLVAAKDEILSTTRLPLALDYLAAELKLVGTFSTAMAKLGHYFTPFQTFVITEAESDTGRFDLAVALKILEREAHYRAEQVTPQGIFLYQFEALCRNRLGYDKGLLAMSGDPIFDEGWREWILTVRRQVGIIDLADLIYVRSVQYAHDQRRSDPDWTSEKPQLFGEKEGRIALANRHKDPLLLFAALHRHLGYPAVPRQEAIDPTPQLLPAMLRRIERLESRLKLVEEEQRGGIDLAKFYARPDKPPLGDE